MNLITPGALTDLKQSSLNKGYDKNAVCLFSLTVINAEYKPTISPIPIPLIKPKVRYKFSIEPDMLLTDIGVEDIVSVNTTSKGYTIHIILNSASVILATGLKRDSKQHIEAKDNNNNRHHESLAHNKDFIQTFTNSELETTVDSELKVWLGQTINSRITDKVRISMAESIELKQHLRIFGLLTDFKTDLKPKVNTLKIGDIYVFIEPKDAPDTRNIAYTYNAITKTCYRLDADLLELKSNTIINIDDIPSAVLIRKPEAIDNIAISTRIKLINQS